jgi:hypothetical protein
MAVPDFRRPGAQSLSSFRFAAALLVPGVFTGNGEALPAIAV